jgi:hypothetical protein
MEVSSIAKNTALFFSIRIGAAATATSDSLQKVGNLAAMILLRSVYTCSLGASGELNTNKIRKHHGLDLLPTIFSTFICIINPKISIKEISERDNECTEVYQVPVYDGIVSGFLQEHFFENLSSKADDFPEIAIRICSIFALVIDIVARAADGAVGIISAPIELFCIIGQDDEHNSFTRQQFASLNSIIGDVFNRVFRSIKIAEEHE